MITKKDIKNAEKFVEGCTDDPSGHDISHVRRVMSNALRIIEADNICDIDVNLTLFCCALHDIDDRKFAKDGEPKHINLQRFCKLYGCDKVFDEACEIIDGISFTDNPIRDDKMRIEAKVAQDADRLDALGAIGIARAFSYGGFTGRSLYSGRDSTVSHFYDKLFKLPELMNTDAARRIAVERVEYMREFITRLENECLAYTK